MLNTLMKTGATVLMAGSALFGAAVMASAEGTKTSAELRAAFDEAVKGKTIAFLPISLGVPLADAWEHVLRTEAEWRGMKYEVRDPSNNPTAMQQALTALVDSRPDVLVVQNPSVTLLMRELKRAEEQGTHVIQVNMASNYKSDAFVGVDWREIGRMIGEDVVQQCGASSGKSGKVAIIQGEITADASIDQMAGINEAFAKDPSIKIVSNQAANWLADTAKSLTDVVIQQDPDLCAHIGFWGIMESGAAQSIRNAGKIDDVKVYASGGGSQLDCDQVISGNFYKYLSYTAMQQGHDLMATALSLLQSGEPAGTRNVSFYTRPVWLTKDNANASNCFPFPLQ